MLKLTQKKVFKLNYNLPFFMRLLILFEIQPLHSILTTEDPEEALYRHPYLKKVNVKNILIC